MPCSKGKIESTLEWLYYHHWNGTLTSEVTIGLVYQSLAYSQKDCDRKNKIKFAILAGPDKKDFGTNTPETTKTDVNVVFFYFRDYTKHCNNSWLKPILITSIHKRW